MTYPEQIEALLEEINGLRMFVDDKDKALHAANKIAALSLLEGERQQHENCQKCLVPCGYCKGDGFTAEHNLESHEEGCNGCPVQVQCEYCHATGKVVPSDVALPSLSPRESGE